MQLKGIGWREIYIWEGLGWRNIKGKVGTERKIREVWGGEKYREKAGTERQIGEGWGGETMLGKGCWGEKKPAINI